MKVILLQDINGVGKKFDVKDLKDGHVRNFLLPRNLVEIATQDSLRKVAAVREAIEERHKKLLGHLQEQAEKLKLVTLNFKIKAGEKGEAYGSVTVKDIESELHLLDFLNVKAELEKPLKKIGNYKVPVSFGEGIQSSLTVLLKAQ